MINLINFQILYQCLYRYFRENDDKRYVGWFVRFLWKNHFRSTIWKVKDQFRDFQELEKLLNL